MPFSGEVRLAARVEQLQAKILGAQLLHVKTTFEIYERDEDTQAATLVESRPDLDLLIDPSDGARVLRHQAADPDAWDDLAADAKVIHIPITCYAKQHEIITDDHSRVVGIVSGSRAGKTHSMSLRLVRQWMLRGGKGHAFWWVSPNWAQTEIGIEKLCTGDAKSDPVFPPELVLYFPKNYHQTNQCIELIDGSKVRLFQASRKGGNLKGYAPHAIFVDEGAEIAHRENWTVMINRLTTHDGTITMATTPVAGHWSRADIVTRAQYVDEVTHYSLSIFDNPWEHPDTIEELIVSLGGHNDPVVRREFYGEWLASGAALWPDWAPERHLVQDKEIWTVDQLREAGLIPDHYVDVTDRMASGYWKDAAGRSLKGATVLIGQDVNVNPCASVIAKGFGDPLDPGTWGLFFIDEHLTIGNIQNHSDSLRTVHDGAYAGAPVSIDPSSAFSGTHQSQGATGNSTNRLEMERFGFRVRSAQMVRGKPEYIRQIDSLNLCYRIQRAKYRFFVSERCAKLCEALDTQERDTDGRISKSWGRADDKLSAPTDGMRYLMWPLFKDELKNKVERVQA